MNPYLLPALLCVVAGMAALALGMERHHRQVFGRGAGDGRLLLLRCSGGLLLALALLPCTLGWGASVGIVLWSGLLSVGVLVSALALAAID